MGGDWGNKGDGNWEKVWNLVGIGEQQREGVLGESGKCDEIRVYGTEWSLF